MTPSLFLQVFSIEVRKLMSYRADFWISALVGFLAQFGLVWFLWDAIYREPGEVIAGYSFDGMVLYYVLVILAGKLVRGAEHVNDLSQDIYEGGLTRYLVYPTSYFGFKYAQHLGHLGPALVQLALFGLLYLLFFPGPEQTPIEFAGVAMAAISIGVANLLYFTLAAPLQGVAFWADNVWSLVVMLRFGSGLLGGAMLPLSLFPDWSQTILACLPFKYLYDFPVNTLLGRVTPQDWLVGLGVSLGWCLVIGTLTQRVWRRGMLSYTGVGI